MTIPHSNDKNTRIRRGLNTLREMDEGRLPTDYVCRCASRVPEIGTRDSSNKRLERNSNALSDTNLRTDNSLIARIPDGETRTRVRTVAISEGSTSPAGIVTSLMCPPTLSSQMKWTFPNPHAACPCIAGLVINMDWDSASSSWRGTAVGCLGNIYCTMQELALVATVGISGTDYATALSTAEGVSHVCGTFNATGNITSDQLTVCGVVAGNSIPVNITER